jgi:haloacetate dehalogenase
MFKGYELKRVSGEGAEINLRIGGKGPPLLLIHGYPQTHVMWAPLAKRLAATFTVVCPDLRGYGDSSKPDPGGDHSGYSKRAMANDLVRVMEELGFDRFSVAGHDRGARVTHRMMLDHEARLERAAVLDIAPTLAMYEGTDMAFAKAYYHWFFLIQPADFPERLIGGDPEFYLRSTLAAWSGTKDFYSEEAFAEYLRCFSDPATIHATCEDYRAGASIDLTLDRADLGRKSSVPLLVLWGEKGLVGRTYDVLSIWKERAHRVEGRALPCGHFVPEEQPEATADALIEFFHR